MFFLIACCSKWIPRPNKSYQHLFKAIPNIVNSQDFIYFTYLQTQARLGISDSVFFVFFTHIFHFNFLCIVRSFEKNHLENWTLPSFIWCYQLFKWSSLCSSMTVFFIFLMEYTPYQSWNIQRRGLNCPRFYCNSNYYYLVVRKQYRFEIKRKPPVKQTHTPFHIW